MLQIPDFHRVLVAHEIELAVHIVVPYWVYVGFAFRVSGSESSGVLLLARNMSIPDRSIPGAFGIALWILRVVKIHEEMFQSCLLVSFFRSR